MRPKTILCGVAVAVGLQLGVLAGSVQGDMYLYGGAETNVTLNPGTYIITAYGAQGGGGGKVGLGAEMSAEFNFSASTTLILLVGGNVGGSGGTGAYLYGVNRLGGGAGGGGGFYGDGGIGNYYYFQGDALGGSSFEDGGAGGLSNFGVVGNFSGPNFGAGGFGGGGGGFTFENFECGGGGGGYSGGGGGGTIFTGGFAGGGGGSIIDSSAIAILAEVSGIASPDDPPYPFQRYQSNGEIIITAVPEPASASLLAIGSLALNRRSRRWRSRAY